MDGYKPDGRWDVCLFYYHTEAKTAQELLYFLNCCKKNSLSVTKDDNASLLRTVCVCECIYFKYVRICPWTCPPS